MERKCCLYAGNGFNCNSPHFILWSQMMKRLFACFNASYIYVSKCVDKLPTNLAYEILLGFLKDNEPEKDLKKIDQDIQKVITKLTCNLMQPNELHEIAVKKYDDIVTPNYDMSFEVAAYGLKDNLPNCLCPSKAPSYPIGLYTNIEVIEKNHKVYTPIKDCSVSKIWHPHSSKQNSGNVQKLCLQYSRYITNVSRLKQCFITDVQESVTPKLKQMIKAQKNNEEIKNKDFPNWAFCFFFEDVDIIGSSLSYEELDFWWVLTYRAELIRKEEINKNRIKFYIPNKKGYSNEEKALYGLLDSLFVEIERVSVSKTDILKNDEDILNFDEYKENYSFDLYLKILCDK